ncbi:hypothetical protein OEB99_02440 [Actinotalea sp. M2MS4P-6]|uniref:FtsX-like permease family protein n=1 Tax=Actinotalea sp. M2MS4P-6 TaxID=2983762 RepID=UPI0021E5069A|nr:FtsX-like permease family protein [Actinotalea sp. M2MS4P-6]MCV2393156.1 hypothetical protein [Actinotalea sp. M2MS4P-6]
MRTLLALAPRLRHGGLTAVLAVVGFAATTAFTISVLAGLLAFQARAVDPPPDLEQLAGTYVLLAGIATALLLVPLTSLAGAAARLGVARRDARLATLRLLGATPREVVALTAIETAAQALAGALLGALGYAALLPLWTSIPFQGREFSAAELWLGWWPLLGVLAGVPLLAAASAVVSLRRVVITPLGVARRETPPGLRATRLWLAVGVVALTAVIARVGATSLAAAVFVGVMIGAVVAVTSGIQAAGPWVVGRLGRLMARRARTPATLLAGRRLVDDPKAAWRVIGGLGLATFVAAVLSVIPALGDPQDVVAADLRTGGLLTFGIAVVLAAVSAGVAQAAAVLDRRRELTLQRLAGVPERLAHAVRRREVAVPTLVVTVLAAVSGWAVVLPLFGLALVSDPASLATVAATVVLGAGLVLAATETARPLVRATLRDTAVRAD